ncbi:hypothetical protein [Microcoleus sp.]|uniref:hypothetical protein n=1 Tax=Microcoleus sp. TaxID=44472 RepID=UPI0035942D3C
MVQQLTVESKQLIGQFKKQEGDRTTAFNKNSIFCKILKLISEDESISIDRDCQLVNICKIKQNILSPELHLCKPMM